MSGLVLYRSAPWAPGSTENLLRSHNVPRNGGLSVRYAQVGDRRFRVVRDDWQSGWFATEVFEDGEDVWVSPSGEESLDARVHGVDYDLKFSAYSTRLADVRRAILEATRA